MLGGRLLARHRASAAVSGSLALLLHNNTSAFLDSSPNAYSIANNGVTCVAAPPRLGAGVGAFGGASRLAVPVGVLNTFGAGDFTVEMFVRFVTIRTSAPGDYSATILLDNCTSNSGVDRGWSFVARNPDNASSHGLTFVWSANGVNTDSFAAAFTFAVDTWYHVAVTRQGNILRLFVNGTVIGTKTDFTATIFSNNKVSSIGDFQEGGWTGSWGLNGYIDEVRVWKGAALYTGNFTPPTAEFS